MAQKIQVMLVCDMCADGKAGTDTIGFGIDGSNYEIDLCDKHAKGLRDAVSSYVGSARRASGGRRGRRSSSRPGGAADRQRTQDIRAWARKKGLKVSERGRISADIVSQYESANKGR